MTRLVYVVFLDFDEDAYHEEHQHGTAERLFAEEIQSDLESCPEPQNVEVLPLSQIALSRLATAYAEQSLNRRS